MRLPVDRRLLARRSAVRREEGRQRLRRLSWGLVGAGLTAGVVGVSFSPLLDVDAVRVSGGAHTGEGAILAALGIHQGRAMFLVDSRAAAEAVERLPWVERADVHRDWPGTVVVTVQERRPEMAVPSPDGRFTLVDGTGRELAAVEQPLPGLPVLEGLAVEPRPGSVLEEAKDALAVVAALPPSVSGRVSRLSVREEGVTLALRSQGEAAEDQAREADVVLGPPTDLPAKVLALATLLADADLAGLRTVDLRVPAAPVLTRWP